MRQPKTRQKSKVFSKFVRMDDDLYNQILDYADKYELSFSQAIRILSKNGLELDFVKNSLQI